MAFEHEYEPRPRLQLISDSEPTSAEDLSGEFIWAHDFKDRIIGERIGSLLVRAGFNTYGELADLGETALRTYGFDNNEVANVSSLLFSKGLLLRPDIPE